MQKKSIKRILTLTIILTIIVWAMGFLGYWGTAHTLIVMGLIITALVLVFIGMITDDNFL